jgi:hypothetical protein
MSFFLEILHPKRRLLISFILLGAFSFSQFIDRISKIGVSNLSCASLEYLFTELGVYRVITRITSNNPSSITLVSFKVIVTLETSSLNIVITGILILVIFG